MKLPALKLVIVPILVAALLMLAVGASAQDTVGDFALTATALAGGATGGTATITPLPSLTPGGPAVATSTPAPAVASPAATGLPTLTPGLRASLTPLPSLTPMGTPAPTEAATNEPTAVPTLAATSTPLPSLTPVSAAPVDELAGTPSGEVELEATAQDAAVTAQSQGLAPVRIEVPYVTPAQDPPVAPEGAAGMGTLILLFGLGGATVIGLLMLARDRYRDHGADTSGDEPGA
jgi:hypothetical protein